MGRRRRLGRDIDGILLLDKPLNLTSNEALQRVKRLFQANKAGHTGSLDPLATGLLPVCLGGATKFSTYLLDADKRYRVRVRLVDSQYWAEVTNFGHRYVRIPDRYVRDYDRLLEQIVAQEVVTGGAP